MNRAALWDGFIDGLAFSASVMFAIFAIALWLSWVAVLPSIGLLWVFGWL